MNYPLSIVCFLLSLTANQLYGFTISSTFFCLKTNLPPMCRKGIYYLISAQIYLPAFLIKKEAGS
ncbi:hypothetical protein CLOBOL_05076 [Enterocloster bolteae ATCC BAA-613]|uniref:Uncharacterized protein n=1 Tax=Enterocloster bolteae (strain ATCC BAA-613 / DSM 15670 / CCUG 46953 / JCM 12243 / WAL 16351) TaxID=411902 RepID=A8RYB1_ENTBW|nr:hypothetical protein CLOBOL_05076 [Enterocloster bolteae ATCC BAA-613]